MAYTTAICKTITFVLTARSDTAWLILKTPPVAGLGRFLLAKWWRRILPNWRPIWHLKTRSANALRPAIEMAADRSESADALTELAGKHVRELVEPIVQQRKLN